MARFEFDKRTYPNIVADTSMLRHMSQRDIVLNVRDLKSLKMDKEKEMKGMGVKRLVFIGACIFLIAVFPKDNPFIYLIGGGLVIVGISNEFIYQNEQRKYKNLKKRVADDEALLETLQNSQPG